MNKHTNKNKVVRNINASREARSNKRAGATSLLANCGLRQPRGLRKSLHCLRETVVTPDSMVPAKNVFEKIERKLVECTMVQLDNRINSYARKSAHAGRQLEKLGAGSVLAPRFKHIQDTNLLCFKLATVIRENRLTSADVKAKLWLARRTAVDELRSARRVTSCR